MVVAAYKATGFVPCSGWGLPPELVMGPSMHVSGCGLSTVCYAAEKGHPNSPSLTVLPIDHVVQALDLNSEYTAGFIIGFDETIENRIPRQRIASEAFTLGVEDGRAAAKAVRDSKIDYKLRHL
jgi:hypothetical protein